MQEQPDIKKIKLMTTLALYDSKKGSKDFRISEYQKKDYTSFNVILSMIWGTVGYFLVLGLIVLSSFDWLIGHFSNGLLIALIIGVIVTYIGTLLIYSIVAGHIYNKRHKKARERVVRYNHYLIQLLKMTNKTRHNK
ncbi:MAG: hypothetical protein LBM02_04680 [Lachnospiraceae bacterium]|jgi:hypothetical protein|nr:hypothetical protein [Lachnospiraceae bacterium]